jgi:hypothetical protein|tara:strand:+ start:297 stop:449 length:153 start_codon:yes stop_codon:yes gene_type:complete
MQQSFLEFMKVAKVVLLMQSFRDYEISIFPFGTELMPPVAASASMRVLKK